MEKQNIYKSALTTQTLLIQHMVMILSFWTDSFMVHSVTILDYVW